MHGDSLSWVLFWVGIAAQIAINLATGLVLSIIFVTLQMQRDLLTKLDEIWILSNQSFNEIWSLRSSPELSVKIVSVHAARLSEEWQRSRRTLKMALTEEQWTRLLMGVSAILELQDLYVHKHYERYWQQHEIETTDDDGNDSATLVDFGDWAAHHNLHEQAKEYATLKEREARAFKQINALLFFDSDAMEKHGDPNKALALPAELERAWNFAFLFPRAWKWFLSEFFGGMWREYKRSREK